MEAYIFAVFLQQFSEVHVQRLKDEAEVLLVGEMSVEPQAVEPGRAEIVT